MRKIYAALAILLLLVLSACGEPEEEHINIVGGRSSSDSQNQNQNVIFSPIEFDAGAVFAHAEVLQIYDGQFTTLGFDKKWTIIKCRILHNFFTQYRSNPEQASMGKDCVFFLWLYEDCPQMDMDAVVDVFRRMDSFIFFGDEDQYSLDTEGEQNQADISAIREQDPELLLPEEAGQVWFRPSVWVNPGMSLVAPIQDGQLATR